MSSSLWVHLNAVHTYEFGYGCDRPTDWLNGCVHTLHSGHCRSMKGGISVSTWFIDPTAGTNFEGLPNKRLYKFFYCIGWVLPVVLYCLKPRQFWTVTRMLKQFNRQITYKWWYLSKTTAHMYPLRTLKTLQRSPCCPTSPSSQSSFFCLWECFATKCSNLFFARLAAWLTAALLDC